MAQLSRQLWVGATLATILALATPSLSWTQQAPSEAVHTAPGEPPAKDDSRTEKQRLLAEQAQRLVTMATELKVEVDKTNKNILSLHVVRTAEQIEALAHKMKDQGRK